MARPIGRSEWVGDASGIRLRLVQGFRLTVDGRRCDLPPAASRLLAYLGLQTHPVPRARVACALWGGHDERHAAACLRSAIWRANACPGVPVIATDRALVALDDSVDVDVRALGRIAHDQLGGVAPPVSPAQLSGELLPGWYDEWVVVERERLRLLCLEAIEQMAEALLRRGQPHLAIEAALTLVAVEPLREAAYRLLVQAYLRSGNRPEALRQYERCRTLLRDELGLEPGQAVTAAAAAAFPHVLSVPSARTA